MSSRKFRNLPLVLFPIMLNACQIVPKETREHILIKMAVDGSYEYQGNFYNAIQLSKLIKSEFMEGKVTSRKLEIHCLKYLRFLQMSDLNTFSKYKMKPVDTKDFKFTSECTGNDVDWTFDN